MVLQQCLPLAVLKLVKVQDIATRRHIGLQQYLPFTVLKRYIIFYHIPKKGQVATVLTVYGIETLQGLLTPLTVRRCCNSTYRLGYVTEYYNQNPEQINLICSGFCLSYFEYVHHTDYYIIMIQPMRDILIKVMLGYILVILIKRFSVIGLYCECKLWCCYRM